MNYPTAFGSEIGGLLFKVPIKLFHPALHNRFKFTILRGIKCSPFYTFARLGTPVILIKVAVGHNYARRKPIQVDADKKEQQKIPKTYT